MNQVITTAIYVTAGNPSGHYRHGFLIQRIDALNGTLIENVGFLEAGQERRTVLQKYFPEAIELYTLRIDGPAWKELKSHRIFPAAPAHVHEWPEKDQCQLNDNWGKKCTKLAGWMISYGHNPTVEESVLACPFHALLAMSEMIAPTSTGTVIVSHYTS